MNWELLIAALTLFVALIVNIVIIAYFSGQLKANQEHQKEMINFLRSEFKEHFDRLEAKQDKHNNIIERQFNTESKVNVHDEKIDVINHRIADLERIVQ